MSPLLSSSLRPALRLRQRAVRFNSSQPNPKPTPEKKAQEVIANAQKSAGQLWESATKKAEEVVGSPETISKNAEKLGKNAGQLWASAKTTLGPTAEKAEALVGSTLQRLGPTGKKAAEMIQPARKSFLYNLAVSREIAKQVYHAELQFPRSASTWRTAYETLYRRATDPAYWRGIVQSGEIAKVGIYAVEAYGIFKIGEIIGRRKIVGYPVH
ncbi:mitochondrial ATP synthase g subunit-domain-containing protein [Mycena haematopus]|nr:mitochondrial ATP synthase g subunit-domain-containing protein [Mycena haematopus]